MKKRVLLIISIFLILVAFQFVAADVNSTQVTNGFSCLANKTTGQCADLPLGQQIFTSLANGLCTGYIQNSSSSNYCWPSHSCDVKTTAQAILALNAAGDSVDNSTQWLTSQNITTSDLAWYLQIDSSQATTCNVSYSGSSYDVNVGSDKKVQLGGSGGGNCLSISWNGYWLLIDPSCYGIPVSVSCNDSFTTTKLYEKTPTGPSQTVYVANSSQSSSSKGTIEEYFNSYCFGSGGTCDYESTLWGTFALGSLGKTISYYLPYLTVEADDSANAKYLPYAFLYYLTSSPNYLTDLLGSQITVSNQNTVSNYWTYNGDSYFGTSLALLAIKSTDSTDSNNAINWLLSVQQPDGCWHNGDVLDTAFVLYSAFGLRGAGVSSTPTPTTPSLNCTDASGYCLSLAACQQVGGAVLNDYSASCPNVPLQICCNKNVQSQTCADLKGQLCSSSQVCNVSSISSSDSTGSQVCCPSTGSCVTLPPTTNLCDTSGGTCKSSCGSGEVVNYSAVCSVSSQYCCIQSTTSEGGNSNTALIIALVVLVVLAALGIIFRKKLMKLWFRMKSKSGGRGGPQPPRYGPRPPPGYPPRSPPGGYSQARRMPQRGPAPRSSSEVNDVLRKLKDMGK